jgi:hypothetical protein
MTSERFPVCVWLQRVDAEFRAFIETRRIHVREQGPSDTLMLTPASLHAPCTASVSKLFVAAN